jgi:hypothetical protein
MVLSQLYVYSILYSQILFRRGVTIVVSDFDISFKYGVRERERDHEHLSIPSTLGMGWMTTRTTTAWLEFVVYFF